MLLGSPGTLSPAVLDLTLSLSTPGALGGSIVVSFAAPRMARMGSRGWRRCSGVAGRDVGRGESSWDEQGFMHLGSWGAGLGCPALPAWALTPSRQLVPRTPRSLLSPPPGPLRQEWRCAMTAQGKCTAGLGLPCLSPIPLGPSICPLTKAGACCRESQGQHPSASTSCRVEAALHPPHCPSALEWGSLGA